MLEVLCFVHVDESLDRIRQGKNHWVEKVSLEIMRAIGGGLDTPI